MGCGPSFVTQEGSYMEGNHVQFKTGCITNEAKAAGCLGRMYEGMNITQGTKESVYNDDKYEKYPKLGEHISKEDFEMLREFCKENWGLTKGPKLEDWQKVIDQKWNNTIGRPKKVYAHCVLYNDTTSVAVVLYSQDAFLALPKDKKEAKARAMKGLMQSKKEGKKPAAAKKPAAKPAKNEEKKEENKV